MANAPSRARQGRAMTLDDLPFDYPSPATRNGAAGRKPCARHLWSSCTVDHFGGPCPYPPACLRCGHPRDPAASRRGKSSVRLGKDQERRIERVYGPRKVGEYGDAVDHLGRDFKWQAKATRSDPPKWLAAITEPTWRAIVPKSILDPMAHMSGIGGMRRPLVIRSYVHHGVPTRDWLFLIWADWYRLHAGDPHGYGYLVIPGAVFLELHGPDAP